MESESGWERDRRGIGSFGIKDNEEISIRKENVCRDGNFVSGHSAHLPSRFIERVNEMTTSNKRRSARRKWRNRLSMSGKLMNVGRPSEKATLSYVMCESGMRRCDGIPPPLNYWNLELLIIATEHYSRDGIYFVIGLLAFRVISTTIERWWWKYSCCGLWRRFECLFTSSREEPESRRLRPSTLA